jgi:hypothetical protein
MLALPVLCALALLTAGCSSSSSSSSAGASAGTSTTAPPASASATAPSTDAALCTDAANLRSSLNELIHVNVGSGAASQITTDLNNVRAALSTLISNAHGQFQPQTSALNTALSNLGTAVSNLASNPGASTIAGVVAAIGRVGTAGQNLLSALNTSCPSASPAST